MQIKHFIKKEFSEDWDLCDPELIKSLDQSRELIKHRIFPSPVKGALARFGGSPTSQHYVGENPSKIIRKSTGSDVFCEGIPIVNFLLIYKSGLFNGIGIYLDTTGPDGLPWVMFHKDIREKGFQDSKDPLIWFGIKERSKITNKIKTRYRYPQVNKKYWELFRDGRLYKERMHQ